MQVWSSKKNITQKNSRFSWRNWLWFLRTGKLHQGVRKINPDTTFCRTPYSSTFFLYLRSWLRAIARKGSWRNRLMSLWHMENYSTASHFREGKRLESSMTSEYIFYHFLFIYVFNICMYLKKQNTSLWNFYITTFITIFLCLP